MKRIVSIGLVLLMILAMVAGCAQEPATQNETTAPAKTDNAQPAAPDAPADESEDEGLFANVEPLETPTALSFGQLSDSQHGFMLYFIEQMGGYEKVGITPSYNVFGNGPVMVEALNSWDCGTYGVGGTLSGSIGHGILVLGAATYDNAIWVFAANDSDVVNAGKVTADAPELYGTADTWNGKEIYLPTGTTLHYALAKGLEKLGLPASSVKLTHMDVSSVNSALLAGQGEFGGLWSNFIFSEGINADYTPVMKAKDVGAAMITVFAANPTSYADPVKKAAIDKTQELYLTVVDWLYDDNGNLVQENLDIFLDYYVQWDEENGVMAVREDIQSMIELSTYVSLEENYRLFTTEMDTEDGKMSELELLNYNVLKFFIDCGNYQPEDVPKLLNNTHISDAVVNLYNNK